MIPGGGGGASLEWKFSQVFGERAAGKKIQEGVKNIQVGFINTGMWIQYAQPWNCLLLHLILVMMQLIDLPFSLYSTFVIDARHGFNKQTIWLILRDMVAGLGLSVLLGPPIVAAIIINVQVLRRRKALQFSTTTSIKVIQIATPTSIKVIQIATPTSNVMRTLHNVSMLVNVNQLLGNNPRQSS